MSGSSSSSSSSFSSSSITVRFYKLNPIRFNFSQLSDEKSKIVEYYKSFIEEVENHFAECSNDIKEIKAQRNIMVSKLEALLKEQLQQAATNEPIKIKYCYFLESINPSKFAHKLFICDVKMSETAPGSFNR
jgi:hypothetical protein